MSDQNKKPAEELKLSDRQLVEQIGEEAFFKTKKKLAQSDRQNLLNQFKNGR